MKNAGSGISPEAFARSTAPLAKATHTPGNVYASPEVFQLEKERMFMRDWLFVARVEEFQKPGDYLTHNVMGEPIVIAMGKDGKLNAFYNQCAHRGVEVVEGSGNTNRFKCPYHAWTYDLEGKLIGAPFMRETEGFDMKNCRLKPLKLDTWAGYVFVSFNPDVEPLQNFIAFFEEKFGMLRQEDCALGYKLVLEFDCNWKFVYENLLDIYHVGTTHAASIARFHDEQSYKVTRGPRGALSINYETQTMTADGKSRFGKMPWLENETERFARIGFMPPNLTLLARHDFVRPVAHWPLSIDKTRSVAYYLFPKEALADPNFKDKVQDYIDYGINVLNEDRGMVMSLQRAMTTRGFEPGRMSTMEHSLHHVISYHLECIFGDDVTGGKAA
jgi:Rieske 2Fe-2S family protein